MTHPSGCISTFPFVGSDATFAPSILKSIGNPLQRRSFEPWSIEASCRPHKDGIKGRQVQSVYFGGGTPTALKTNQLITILSGIRQSFAPPTVKSPSKLIPPRSPEKISPP